jgi:hypothetical protein
MHAFVQLSVSLAIIQDAVSHESGMAAVVLGGEVKMTPVVLLGGAVAASKRMKVNSRKLKFGHNVSWVGRNHSLTQMKWKGKGAVLSEKLPLVRTRGLSWQRYSARTVLTVGGTSHHRNYQSCQN